MSEKVVAPYGKLSPSFIAPYFPYGATTFFYSFLQKGMSHWGKLNIISYRILPAPDTNSCCLSQHMRSHAVRTSSTILKAALYKEEEEEEEQVVAP